MTEQRTTNIETMTDDCGCTIAIARWADGTVTLGIDPCGKSALLHQQVALEDQHPVAPADMTWLSLEGEPWSIAGIRLEAHTQAMIEEQVRAEVGRFEAVLTIALVRSLASMPWMLHHFAAQPEWRALAATLH